MCLYSDSYQMVFQGTPLFWQNAEEAVSMGVFQQLKSGDNFKYISPKNGNGQHQDNKENENQEKEEKKWEKNMESFKIPPPTLPSPPTSPPHRERNYSARARGLP